MAAGRREWVVNGCWEEGCDYVKTKGCTGIGNERRKNNIGG